MTGTQTRPTDRLGTLVLALLLLGAVVNLAAGLRRPLRERALRNAGYYAAAEDAARAVQARGPATDPVSLVVFDDDHIGAMDGGGWAETYFNWLLYPRPMPLYRAAPDGRVRPVKAMGLPKGLVLWFRVQGPVSTSDPNARAVAWGDTWMLTESHEEEHALKSPPRP